MDIKIRAELLGRTEVEIREEMATALGRIGRILEALISELHEIRKVAVSCPQDEKEDHRQMYRKIRSKARLYYWYLMIQRESIGIRNHDLLPSMYPIPPVP